MAENLEKKSTVLKIGKILITTLPVTAPIALGIATGIGNYNHSSNMDNGIITGIMATIIYSTGSALAYVGIMMSDS